MLSLECLSKFMTSENKAMMANSRLKRQVIYLFQIGLFGACKIWSWKKWHKQKIWISIPKDKKNIVVANHITPKDPILLIKSTSWKTFLNLAPLKIMIDYTQYKKIYRKWSWLFGCYPSLKLCKKTQKNISLKKSVNYLNDGYSVLIFPEWWSKIKKPGIGAWYLNTNTPDSQLMLFHINPRDHLVSYKGTKNYYGTKTKDLRDIHEDVMPKIV